MSTLEQWLWPAHSFNLGTSPNTFVLPFAVLALVVLISMSYKDLIQRRLSPTKKQRLIDIHALATELCQLVLVGFLFMDIDYIVKTVMQLSVTEDISTVEAAYLIEAAVAASFAVHVIAIFAVDVIEGRILLGSWTHPYKWQPFVLTRRWTQGCMEQERPRHRAGRKNNVDEQTLKQGLSAAKMKMDYRIAKLNYLDLAGFDQGQQSRKMQTPPSTPTTSTAFPRSDMSVHSAKEHQVADLPTPPDSDQPNEAKKVKWAPTITIVSSSGVERRMSLP